MTRNTSFEVPKDLMQGIVDYLVTRPYGEVAGLIHLMQACKQVVPHKPDDGSAPAE